MGSSVNQIPTISLFRILEYCFVNDEGVSCICVVTVFGIPFNGQELEDMWDQWFAGHTVIRNAKGPESKFL